MIGKNVTISKSFIQTKSSCVEESPLRQKPLSWVDATVVQNLPGPEYGRKRNGVVIHWLYEMKMKNDEECFYDLITGHDGGIDNMSGNYDVV